ncbi:MAG TPA: alanine dehydrogenase [Dehalococcoidia bacterium]|nr:alanine dehydrogenase [Dehalococcoidia bacterium]
MIVGTVREIKCEEYRVGLTPEGAHALAEDGHTVLVEAGAGAGAGIADAAYEGAGATLVEHARDVWSRADVLVKVKEPLEAEHALVRDQQTLFTYLHLAALPGLTRVLLDSKVTAIAYETVQLSDGSLPLLAPMSQIAGRMATEIGSQYLRKPGPGKGKLISGLPGAPPAHVVVLGAGTVAENAIQVAVGLGARVTVFDTRLDRLRHIEERWPGRTTTMVSSPMAISSAISEADVVVCAVLVPGASAPKLVTREMVRSMGTGSVIVDVSIDQGGTCETSRVTTHADPVYVEEGVVHYCVANMPGAVPVTSTAALTAATLPYVREIARLGPRQALLADEALAKGVLVSEGHVVHPGLAASLGLPRVPLAEAMPNQFSS